MNDILELMDLGQWEEAEKRFKGLMISPRQFTDFMDDLPREWIIKFALLGFYCKKGADDD